MVEETIQLDIEARQPLGTSKRQLIGVERLGCQGGPRFLGQVAQVVVRFPVKVWRVDESLRVAQLHVPVWLQVDERQSGRFFVDVAAVVVFLIVNAKSGV